MRRVGLSVEVYLHVFDVVFKCCLVCFIEMYECISKKSNGIDDVFIRLLNICLPIRIF